MSAKIQGIPHASVYAWRIPVHYFTVIAKIHPKSPAAMDFGTPESLSYGQRSKCTDLLNSYTVPIHYKQNFSMGQAKPGNFGGLRVPCRHCPDVCG